MARAWPAAGPRVLWSAEVAEGFAGAAVYDGQVYLLDRVEDKQDTLRCWDLESGVEVWHAAYEAPGRLPYNGTRNVPTVDERYVFTVGPLGHVRCLDRRSHQVLWTAHLVDDFKDPEIDTAQAAETREQKLERAQVPMWGLTQAPLLYQDTVILAPQTQKTGLVAYEKATGKIRWRTGYVGRNWYSHVSPYLATLAGWTKSSCSPSPAIRRKRRRRRRRRSSRRSMPARAGFSGPTPRRGPTRSPSRSPCGWPMTGSSSPVVSGSAA